MRSTLELFSLFIGISGGLSGVSLNSWILAVNIQDWRKDIQLRPCDLIICLVALTNVLMQNAFIIDVFIGSLHPQILSARRLHLLFLDVQIFIISCNCCFIVWLCVYYCLKIVNFSVGFFLILKLRFSDLLPKFLLLSVLLSFCLAVPSFWNIFLLPSQGITENITDASAMYDIHVRQPYVVVFLMECSLYLILTIIPLIFILNLLWEHTTRIKKSSSDFYGPRLQVHVLAIRMMLRLAIFAMIFYMVTVTMTLYSFNIETLVLYFCRYWFLYYPTIQAIVLIHGNSKMTTSFQKVRNTLKRGCNLNMDVNDLISL